MTPRDDWPGEVDARYSDTTAPPMTWGEVRDRFTAAEVYWIATIRGDRPHVTPLIAVWHDGSVYICAGDDEQKSRNIARNPHCSLTTGVNLVDEGVDVVLEGVARRVTGRGRLAVLAEEWPAKYGDFWRFRAVDDGFLHGDATGDEAGSANVYEITPVTVYAFAKGDPYGQTRWRLADAV